MFRQRQSPAYGETVSIGWAIVWFASLATADEVPKSHDPTGHPEVGAIRKQSYNRLEEHRAVSTMR